MDKNVEKIITRIVGKIEESGGIVYLVGGCIRDNLLGRESIDYDLVTNLRPNVLEGIFSDGFKVDLVGKSFGVVIVDGIEVATFRRDKYLDDNIHTKGADTVEFSDTIEEDLSRRDFTINAMARRCLIAHELTFSDEIIDPFNGQSDLMSKKIKFVGNPSDRIREDPCRILRAFRFNQLLLGGGDPIDHHLQHYDRNPFYHDYLHDVISNKSLFLLIAPERIRMELLKVMTYERVDSFIEDLRISGLLNCVFPSLAMCIGVDGGQRHKESVYTHCLLVSNSISKKYPLLRLAALLHDVGKPQTVSCDENGITHFYNHEDVSHVLVARDLERLKFGNKEIDYMCEVIKKHMFFFEEITKDSTYRRFMSNLKVPVRDVLRMRIADRKGNMLKKDRSPITFIFRKTLKKIRKIEKENKCLKLSDLDINGCDLISMGCTQGPEIGKILKLCLEHVLEDPSRNKKDVLMEYAVGLLM